MQERGARWSAATNQGELQAAYFLNTSYCRRRRRCQVGVGEKVRRLRMGYIAICPFFSPQDGHQPLNASAVRGSKSVVPFVAIFHLPFLRVDPHGSLVTWSQIARERVIDVPYGEKHQTAPRRAVKSYLWRGDQSSTHREQFGE